MTNGLEQTFVGREGGTPRERGRERGNGPLTLFLSFHHGQKKFLLGFEFGTFPIKSFFCCEAHISSGGEVSRRTSSK